MRAPNVLIGNLFDSQAQTLVNTVNTVGVMGKGAKSAWASRTSIERCSRHG